MTERQEICAVTAVGAAVGAIASYLFFTDRGAALRRRFLPALDELEQELGHFRSTITRTAGMASEGWRMLNEAIGETSRPAPRSMNPHQTAPF